MVYIGPYPHLGNTFVQSVFFYPIISVGKKYNAPEHGSILPGPPDISPADIVPQKQKTIKNRVAMGGVLCFTPPATLPLRVAMNILENARGIISGQESIPGSGGFLMVEVSYLVAFAAGIDKGEQLPEPDIRDPDLRAYTFTFG
jgi:hypothetical protein